jgi:hypothetical protein
MMGKTLDVSLTKAQIEFLQLDCPFPAYFGGFGCGKSHLMGFSAVMDAHHSKDALIGIYEPSHDLIRTVAIPRIEYWLEQFKIKFDTNHNTNTIDTRSDRVGNFIFKTMADPDALVGYETYRSHLDELDTLPPDRAEKVWFKLMGRNRQVPRGIPEQYKKWSEKNQRYEVVNRMSAYTTPEGFRFCHKMWVGNENKDFQYVKGKTEDNPTLTEAYIEQLRASYPPELIEAYMNGEFVNLNSGTVYNCYDRVKHRSFETIRGLETLYIGCDFNVTNQAASIYVKRGGKEWHMVYELTGMYDTPDMIRIIKERWADKGHRIIMYPDATGRNRRSSDASQSDILLLRMAGFEVRAKNKNPPVKDRIAAMNKALTDMIVFVNDSMCPQGAKCLEQQAYDKNGEPDKRSGFDHHNDASTYPIVYELGLTPKLFHIPFNFAHKY